jgi:hypothetical protein
MRTAQEFISNIPDGYVHLQSKVYITRLDHMRWSETLLGSNKKKQKETQAHELVLQRNTIVFLGFGTAALPNIPLRTAIHRPTVT